MCRFVAYLGDPIVLDDLIFKPKYSLVNQSIKANELEEPLNGDGFGVGWYAPEIDPEPAVFVSVRPAWNDRNLLYMAPIIKSNCIFAHVRAASLGYVNELNCHPFHYKKYLFMHNGDIEGFDQIKRKIEQNLSEETYEMIQGQTDSEHLFAMIMDILDNKRGRHTVYDMANAMEEAIRKIQAIKKKNKIRKHDYINAAFTDGKQMVAIRYTNNNTKFAPSLYYSEGSAYVCKNGVCRMRKDVEERAVLIVSEKLTGNHSDYKEIPANHLCIVNNKWEVELRKCDI